MIVRSIDIVRVRGLLVAFGILSGLSAALFAPPAFALEKYGRPLPSLEAGDDESRGAEESLFAGYLLTGVFLSTPSFTARPDNTGRVGLRHMLHLEHDLYKQYVTFYSDQNFFSDRDNGWIEFSEWDGTYALTGVLDRFSWRMQYERDAPLDKRGLKQAYGDALVTARFNSHEDAAWFDRLLPGRSLSAYAGGGWLFHNDHYFARPDNSGRALFRYVAHFDLNLYRDRVVLYGDTNWFTDREKTDKLAPSELDWI